ncbi:hypothetical protein EVAR_78979_1 [Eumeta japonica]|uniref:Uncharacterized protein n=1 Tax=Eumeta variegata TaxID=151549 RepID=A0A4C1US53_EUMVA|nr:hypothetical protein EVAR_78979_1 [Eumeta japonica]
MRRDRQFVFRRCGRPARAAMMSPDDHRIRMLTLPMTLLCRNAGKKSGVRQCAGQQAKVDDLRIHRRECLTKC